MVSRAPAPLPSLFPFHHGAHHNSLNATHLRVYPCPQASTIDQQGMDFNESLQSLAEAAAMTIDVENTYLPISTAAATYATQDTLTNDYPTTTAALAMADSARLYAEDLVEVCHLAITLDYARQQPPFHVHPHPLTHHALPPQHHTCHLAITTVHIPCSVPTNATQTTQRCSSHTARSRVPFVPRLTCTTTTARTGTGQHHREPVHRREHHHGAPKPRASGQQRHVHRQPPCQRQL
jgi:hypothetical protein